jgi:two-component system phosphate regulon sensor histidine kinase PhoR
MKRSIFFKVFIGYFLIIILLSSLILFFSLHTIRNFYISTLTDNLKKINRTLLQEITPLVANQSQEELDGLAKELGESIATRITIIDTSGVVLADSEKDPKTMENHRFRPEIKKALQGSTGESIRYSATVKEEMLYVAQPIQENDTIIGVIRTSLFLKDIHFLLGNIRRRIVQISLILIVLSLVGAFIFTRRLSKPIKALVSGTRRVASGDFNTKVFLNRGDELRELADNFNTMTEKVKHLFTDLSLRREELDSIISSMQQGLLVINKNGNITLANHSAKKLLQTHDLENKPYWEVFREPNINSLIERVQQEQRSDVEEIELNDRVLVSSATYVTGKEEIVLIFHDITKSKNLEKVKRDFVVNVSHELRTPLTAIKGFVETLEEEVNKKHHRYLKIIKRHTERLISITNDLTLLSELEDKKYPLKIQDINVKDLISNVHKMFTQRLDEKQIEFKTSISKGIATIKGDMFKLEQLFINLIDNAINYTEKGCIEVTVKEDGANIVIEVADTGIGISTHDLPRIFERFYVVDKSRSKKQGGTGLGLSIVKHIVLLHNGTISVESEENIGTTFTITLPLSQ